MKGCLIALIVCSFFAGSGAETILLNQDFRTGSAGKAGVINGKFDNGWKQVPGETPPGRIIYYSKTPIMKGYAEITFTVDELSTSLFTQDKNIYFSIYKASSLDQKASSGHYGYVRIRKEPERNYFVEFKAFDKPADETEGETRVCCRDNWNNYKGKVAVMRLAWSDASNITLTYPNPTGSGSKTAQRPYKVTGIQFIVIGAEGSYHASVYSFRYLSMKIVSLDPPTAAEQGPTKSDFAINKSIAYPRTTLSLTGETSGKQMLGPTGRLIRGTSRTAGMLYLQAK